MLFLYLVFLAACLGLLAGGVIEQRNHHRSLHSIPHRVLVNGIRGKSSITRLTAGALRGGKMVVVAKTTGTAARFIFPDASEEPVYRKFGIANVVEQIGIVRRAASYYPDALVIECMAVMPPLQELNQTKLIRSTIGILCNVREDHLAEMGPTLDDVARSLSRSMPVGGICVTAEQDRLHILQEEADKRRCTLVPVYPESVADEEMKGFTWTTFKENVAIALKVAELLGVPREAAVQGMWTAPPDPGVLSVEEYRAGDRSLRFANIFAANDPESTYMNIQQLADQGSIPRPLHVLINCRPDRVERNGQMGSLIARIDPDKVILIGEPTRSARAKIDAQWQDRVVDLGGRIPARELLDGVLGTIDGFASVLAIGNIHGQGEILLAQLAGLEQPAPQDRAAPPARPAGRQPYGEPEPRVPLPVRSPGRSGVPAGPAVPGRPGPLPPHGFTPPAPRDPHDARPARVAAHEPYPPLGAPYGERRTRDDQPYGGYPARPPRRLDPYDPDGPRGQYGGPPVRPRSGPPPQGGAPQGPPEPARYDPDRTMPTQPVVRRPPVSRPDQTDPDTPPPRPSTYWSPS
ncbi:poly-gamma-glutamate synthase PgsB [Micromonospora mangrovi]|uniref:Poly-gamma-glutamate synthase PgsB n=2 Tax=Micromonospora TaxID=1873 RepID=A0AAU8HA49_9ACTN